MSEHTTQVRAADGTDRTYTYEQVQTALNKATDDINEAARLPDEGVIDALNLLVNAAGHYLTQPEPHTLAAAVEGNYDVDLDEILDWINQ